MSTQFVQGIIINENKVLHAYGSNSNNIPVEFFLRGEIKNEETTLEAINREIKEQLNLLPNIIFQLKEEFIGNVTTFLIEIGEEQLNTEETKISKNITGIHLEGFRWVSLYDKEKFNSTEISYLKKTYEQCLEKNYKGACISELEAFSFANNNFPYETARLLNKKRIIKSRNVDKEVSFGEKLSTIALAMLLGIIFKAFFWKRSFGVSAILFTNMFFAFFFWANRKKIIAKPSIGWFLLIPTFLTSIYFSIHSNIFLTALNILMLPLLVTAATLLLTYRELPWWKLSFVAVIFKKITKLTFENCLKPFIFIKENLSSKEKKEISPTKKNIIRGLLISIPILLVVFPLLASADMVFNFYIAKAFTVFENINLPSSFGSIIIVLIASLYIFGYVWGFKYSYDEGPNKGRMKLSWEPVTVLTIIFIINVVYLIFSIIQFSYLYCGGINSLPNGYSFSEYARQGFFELVAVTVINFGILLCSMKFMSKENKTLNKVSNIFLNLLVVFTLNMLFSAHYKMTLYETVCGFTYLRVFVHLFMVLLFLLIIIALAGIWFKKLPIVKASIVVTAVMYLVLNYMNVDAFIARKNIESYKETGKIDIHYLSMLSYDALPEIAKLKDDKNTEVSKEVNSYLNEKRDELSKEHSWLEFNLSKDKARKVIENNESSYNSK